MAALKVPTVYDPDSILIADDEPEHLDWLVDFLETQGKKVAVVTNVKDALELSEVKWFRAYIVDLNIPLGGWVEPIRNSYINYPGFSIIEAIRSQGNDGRRVIAYSAHQNDQIASEMKRLYTDYVAKGRPMQLKDRLLELWQAPDQTEAMLKRVAAWNLRRLKDQDKRNIKKSNYKVSPKPQPVASKGSSRNSSIKPALKRQTAKSNSPGRKSQLQK